MRSLVVLLVTTLALTGCMSCSHHGATPFKLCGNCVCGSGLNVESSDTLEGNSREEKRERGIEIMRVRDAKTAGGTIHPGGDETDATPTHPGHIDLGDNPNNCGDRGTDGGEKDAQ